jgi:hypothetical protein
MMKDKIHTDHTDIVSDSNLERVVLTLVKVKIDVYTVLICVGVKAKFLERYSGSNWEMHWEWRLE